MQSTMIKKICIATFLLFSTITLAQQGTSSPYSYFGIGDVRYRGMLENRSMGGVAVEQDSIHINIDNPSSYANLKLTTMTMAGTHSERSLKEEGEKASARRTTLDYMAVAIPVGRLGFGFGLIPYSSVGYKIQSISADGTENNKRLEGTGGVNKVFFGAGYKIAKNFSIGADAHYVFGKIENDNLEFITDVPVGTRERNLSYLSGFNFNIGAMYKAQLSKKLQLHSSVSYSLETNLDVETTRTISTIDYNGTVNIDPEGFDEVVTNREVVMPSKVTFGLGVGEAKKWLIGAEVALRPAVTANSNYNNVTNVQFEKYNRYSLGGYYIPNYNSFSSYAKRIVYRAGLRLEQTGLVINNQAIDDKTLSVGVGLPAFGSFSNFNVGLEYGVRGTSKQGLIQENYFNASVSFSLNDKWFVKRKFY